jgi:PAS domain S-box-containing protein
VQGTGSSPPGKPAGVMRARRSARMLLAAFIVLACLIAATGYWVWSQQASTMKSTAERSINAVAHLKADEIAGWLDERHGDAALISKSSWMAGEAAALDSGSASAPETTRVAARLRQYREAYGYATVMLLAPDGRTLASSPQGGAFPQGVRTALLARHALRTGEVVWSDIYLGYGGLPRLETAAPLLGSSKGSAATGVVMLVSDPSRFLYPVLQDWPLQSASGETVLAERRGDRVVYLNELRFRKGTALHLSLPLDQTKVLAVKAVTGRSGAFESVDYRGVPVFAAVQPVPGASWHVIAKLDSAEVLAPVRRRGVLTAGVTVLLVALTGLGTLLVWRRRETQVGNELLIGERRYRSLVENLSAGVVVHAPDTHITFANPRACELLGRTLDQLGGKTAMDPYWRFLREDGSTMPIEEFPVEQVVTTGEPLRDLVVGTVHAEGVEPVWTLCNAFPQHGPDGALTEVVVTFVDATERVVTERRLRTSERKFRETVEHLDEGYFSTSLDGAFLDYNPALLRILALPAGTDLRGKTSEGFWWEPGDRMEWIERLGHSEHVLEYMADLRTADGERRTVVLSAHLIRDAAGEPLRMDGSATDITGLRRAQEEIERLNETLEQRVAARTAELDAANKELEAFAYSVSHDLRAPLRHVSGFSSLLAERSSGGLDEKSRHYVDVIIKSVNEMGRLIDDLLEFSRTGRVELTIEPVDMDVVVQEALAPLRNETDGRDIDWSIEPLPPADADRALIRQVWVNLLGNAAKYTRRATPARISVTGKLVDGQVVYTVRDNGVGFDMQYAHKLFGVFQRLHDASVFEGTGIGLANVHRIVTRLHGRVWAQGEPGKGATFSFSLPVRKETT